MVSNSSITHELQAGELFCDRYRIRKRIADGGMASIYLAVDETSGLHVAIKVLFSHYLDNGVIRTRFLDEGRIQAMLRHPNIVHVYRVLSKPMLCFVMEYVDGVTLEDYLQQRGPLGEGEILEILLPVMSAVGFAHSKGIIHRDIKPSNILIKNVEGFIEPKVMDFGVAKVTSGRDLTAAGTTVGTLHYMSPEQIVGSRTIDGRADIYSLGVTLYKLSTGDVPFNASTEFALMMAQVEAPPMPPRSIRPEISRGLEEIILRALEKEPARRFQSIKEFTSALMSLSDQSHLDTDTRPIPAEILKFAMMADEVATDRTAEITFDPIEAIEEQRSKMAASVVIDETTDMMSPHLDALLKDDQQAGWRRSLQTKAGDRTEEDALEHVSTTPRTLEINDANFKTWEAKRPEGLLQTIEDDAFEARRENTEEKATLQWQFNPDAHDRERGREGGRESQRGVVGLDAGADSHEVTGLNLSKKDFRKALEAAKAQARKSGPRSLFDAAHSPAQAEDHVPFSSPGRASPPADESTRPERPSASMGRVADRPLARPIAPEPMPVSPFAAPASASERAPSQEPIATERRQVQKQGLSRGVWVLIVAMGTTAVLFLFLILVLARLRGA